MHLCFRVLVACYLVCARKALVNGAYGVLEMFTKDFYWVWLVIQLIKKLVVFSGYFIVNLFL